MDTTALIAFVVELINKILDFLKIDYDFSFGAKAPVEDEEITTF